MLSDFDTPPRGSSTHGASSSHRAYFTEPSRRNGHSMKDQASGLVHSTSTLPIQSRKDERSPVRVCDVSQGSSESTSDSISSVTNLCDVDVDVDLDLDADFGLEIPGSRIDEGAKDTHRHRNQQHHHFTSSSGTTTISAASADNHHHHHHTASRGRGGAGGRARGRKRTPASTSKKKLKEEEESHQQQQQHQQHNHLRVRRSRMTRRRSHPGSGSGNGHGHGHEGGGAPRRGGSAGTKTSGSGAGTGSTSGNRNGNDVVVLVGGRRASASNSASGSVVVPSASSSSERHSHHHHHTRNRDDDDDGTRTTTTSTSTSETNGMLKFSSSMRPTIRRSKPTADPGVGVGVGAGAGPKKRAGSRDRDRHRKNTKKKSSSGAGLHLTRSDSPGGGGEIEEAEEEEEAGGSGSGSGSDKDILQFLESDASSSLLPTRAIPAHRRRRRRENAERTTTTGGGGREEELDDSSTWSTSLSDLLRSSSPDRSRTRTTTEIRNGSGSGGGRQHQHRSGHGRGRHADCTDEGELDMERLLAEDPASVVADATQAIKDAAERADRAKEEAMREIAGDEHVLLSSGGGVPAAAAAAALALGDASSLINSRYYRSNKSGSNRYILEYLSKTTKLAKRLIDTHSRDEREKLEMERRIEEQGEQICQLQAELEGERRRRSDLDLEVVQKKEENEELRRLLDSQEREVLSLRKTTEGLKSDFDIRAQKADSEINFHRHQCRDVSRQADELRKRLEFKKQEAEGLREDIQEKDGEILERDRKIAVLLREKEVAQELESVVTDLRDRNGCLERETRSLDEKIQKMTDMHRDEAREWDLAKKQHMKRVERLFGENQTSLGRIETLKATLNKCKDALLRKREIEERLLADKRKQQHDSDQLRTEISFLTKTSDRQRQSIAELIRRLEEQQKKNEEENSRIKKEFCDRLSRMREESRARNAQHEAEMSSLREEKRASDDVFRSRAEAVIAKIYEVLETAKRE